jgi:hypothetical protein
MTTMQYINTFSAIALTAAVLGIAALTTSGDASALARFGGLQKTGPSHGPPLCWLYPSHIGYCPPGDVGGTNKWTCKQNGEGCYRQK